MSATRWDIRNSIGPKCRKKPSQSSSSFNFNLDPDFHEDTVEAEPPHEVDDEHNITYAIAGEIRSEDFDALQKDIDSQADWLEEIFSDHEGEFGVHDRINGPDERVLCIGGYSTCEMEPARVHELMASWRTALITASGFDIRPGPVVRVASETDSDRDIYQDAVAAGSKP